MTDELCQRSAQVGQISTTCDAADEKKHWRAARRVSDIEMAIIICTYFTIKMWDSACNNMYKWTWISIGYGMCCKRYMTGKWHFCDFYTNNIDILTVMENNVIHAYV